MCAVGEGLTRSPAVAIAVSSSVVTGRHVLGSSIVRGCRTGSLVSRHSATGLLSSTIAARAGLCSHAALMQWAPVRIGRHMCMCMPVAAPQIQISDLSHSDRILASCGCPFLALQLPQRSCSPLGLAVRYTLCCSHGWFTLCTGADLRSFHVA